MRKTRHIRLVAVRCLYVRVVSLIERTQHHCLMLVRCGIRALLLINRLQLVRTAVVSDIALRPRLRMKNALKHSKLIHRNVSFLEFSLLHLIHRPRHLIADSVLLRLLCACHGIALPRDPLNR